MNSKVPGGAKIKKPTKKAIAVFLNFLNNCPKGIFI
jgi:hypothetical protein